MLGVAVVSTGGAVHTHSPSAHSPGRVPLYSVLRAPRPLPQFAVCPVNVWRLEVDPEAHNWRCP